MARYFRTFGETLKDTVKSLIIPDREYAVGTALADSLSDTYLKQAMCMDLVFRKDLDFGDVPGDSLASTSGNVFHHPVLPVVRSDGGSGQQRQDMEDLGVETQTGGVVAEDHCRGSGEHCRTGVELCGHQFA